MGETETPTLENQTENFAYWGDMLDRAQKVVKRGDEKEISLIGNIIKMAYELFSAQHNQNDNSAISINAKNNYGSNQVVVSA